MKNGMRSASFLRFCPILVIMMGLILPVTALGQNTGVVSLRASDVAYCQLIPQSSVDNVSCKGAGVRPEALMWYTGGQNFNLAFSAYLEAESLTRRTEPSDALTTESFVTEGGGLGVHITFKAIPYFFVAAAAGVDTATYKHTTAGKIVTDSYPLGLACAGSWGFGSSVLGSGLFLQNEVQIVNYTKDRHTLPQDMTNAGLIKKSITVALGFRWLL